MRTRFALIGCRRSSCRYAHSPSRRLGRGRSRGSPPVSVRPVTVRWEAPDDHDAVHELEELSGAPILQGTLLVAEQADRIVAAIALESGRVVADPFVPTADVQALLTFRAEQVRPYLAV